MKFLLIFLNVVAYGLCANVPQEISVEPFGLFEDIVNNQIIKPILDIIPSNPITLIQHVDLPLFSSQDFKLNISITNLELRKLNSLIVNCTKVSLLPLQANILIVPHIEINTNYTLDMVAGDQVINGHGNINFVLDTLNIEAEANLAGSLLPALNFTIVDLSIKFPDQFKNAIVELTIIDEDDPSFAVDVTNLVVVYIQEILNLIGPNDEAISNIIGPIIKDIINGILSPVDPNTTPDNNDKTTTTTPNPTSSTTEDGGSDDGTTLPDGGSASTASYSLFMLVTLICTYFFNM